MLRAWSTGIAAMSETHARSVIMTSPGGQTPLRVMIVDDSAFVRALLSGWIAAEPDMRVAAVVRNGQAAVEEIVRAAPDVVLLDVEMPEMDGISALPLLLEKRPGVAIIMVSALTRRHADASIQALMRGAADYIAKPNARDALAEGIDFRHDLVRKVRELGSARRGLSAPQPRWAQAAVRQESGEMLRPVFHPAAGRRPHARNLETIRLRPMSPFTPHVLLLGASTGGPQLLAQLFAGLGPVIDHVPVVLVQHMPSPFTSVLAEHLTRVSGRPAAEAVQGEPIRAGRTYVAPGGHHLRVERRGGEPVAVLDDGPPLHHCRPAVDILFESAATAWGRAVLAAVLTGMGVDGARGATRIVEAGGSVIAQDEASSVVWGMPGATARTGACSELVGANAMASRLRTLFGRSAT